MNAPVRTTRWTGWEPRTGAAAPDDPGAVFAERIADAGEDRYEFLAVAARGFRPPRFLTVQDLASPSGAEHDAATGTSDPVLRQTWSMEYRELAATAPRAVAPHAIYLLGVNPPEGVTDGELEVFNDFYTNVHLPEVAERRHALRAVRYELARLLKPPYPSAPRFLAAYEVDEAGSSNRRHTGPPYSSGPEVWQRHTTPWRLWYRYVAT